MKFQLTTIASLDESAFLSVKIFKMKHGISYFV